MTVDNVIEDVLAEMARLLRVDGWCQGALVDDEGRRCLAGALLTATADLSDAMEDQVRVCVEEALPRGTIAAWNDTPGRTVEEVLEVIASGMTALSAPT